MRFVGVPIVIAGILAVCFFSLVPGMPGYVDLHVRTGAVGPAQLGKVNFPTSCNAQAQATIEKGVALLHSFQYMQSEQTFAESAQLDPQCAMAQWGKAMAVYHQLWDFPGAETLKEGRQDIEEAKKLGAGTEREREYIAAAAAFYQDDASLTHTTRAQAYSSAMEKVRADNPKDTNAAAFYALSLVALAEYDEQESANRKKALAILNPLFASDPDNPGVAHYIIHASDTPELAPEGLAAARRYAQIAPDSSHALHMPSHIFTRLGLWQESIDSNIAAIASASKEIQMHMAESHYQTHAMDFLNYAYLQSGQESKARGLIADMKTVRGASEREITEKQSLFEARDALELHHWKEAASLGIPKLPPRELDVTYWARAIGAARSGDAAGAREDVQSLIDTIAARERRSKDQGYKVNAGESVDQREAEAWLAYAEGKADEALKTMRGAVEREDLYHVDSLGMPAREMLADLLLELKRPEEALAAYQAALKESPNRFDSLYGAARAAESAGKTQEAKTYYAQLSKIAGPGADRPELQEAKIYLARK
jgi:tetratricopeptide (TPR) repeat protein